MTLCSSRNIIALSTSKDSHFACSPVSEYKLLYTSQSSMTNQSPLAKLCHTAVGRSLLCPPNKLLNSMGS